MALFLTFLIFGLSICSLVCAIVGLLDKNYTANYKYFSITAIGSTIWGLGFGFLLIQKTPEAALLCRTIGMAGLFFFFVFVPRFFLDLANSPKWLRKIIDVYSLIGLILYPISVMPERQTFYMSKFGMSYTLTNDIWNTLYYGYAIVYTILGVIILVIMRKNAKYKRTKVLNFGLWVFVLITFLGSILDTLFPMIGVAAFPGSTLGQFLATFVGFFTFLYQKKNTLTLQTVTNHIYHSIDLPIFVINTNNKIEFMSDSGYKFFNLEKDKINSVSITDLFILDYDADFLINNYTNIECNIKNNNLYCSVSIDKVKDSFGDVIGHIFIINDLTEKNKYITELKEAKEQAEKAKIEAENASHSKDNFLANMSHELRTPLNAIIGINELIQSDEGKSNVIDYSNQIAKSSKNLLSMIDELFDFSKIQTGKLDIVENEYSIIEVLKNVISSFKDSINEKGLIYEVKVDNEVPSILMGDQKRIRQCIVNILKNSIKYTKSGKISINVSSSILNDKCNLKIEIIDSGIGINSEDIKNLFISFKGLEATNNRNYEGIGIGLTIVKKLMLLMNGKFDISSEYDQGTKCVLDLPQVIIDSSLCGGYEDENSLCDVCIIDDKTIEMSVLKKVLQKEYVDVTICDKLDLNYIKENNFDFIFVNYNGELISEEVGNVIYLVEDDINLDGKVVLKKPINKVALLNLIRKDKEDVIKEAYCPNVRMLAVDDNKLNLVVLKGFLKKTGATIDSCNSGAEALSLTEKNNYDIIFLDHMMPGMDGVETLKKIRTQNNDNASVPILVVTANAVEGAREFYLEQGFTDYISKPIDSDYLNSCLFKYLGEDKVQAKTNEE